MPVSPSTDNLYIGKGTITIQATGETSPRDVGEVSEFEFTPSIEKLAYYSSRSGVRKKTKEVIIEKGGTLRMVMDEVTAENLALAVAGTTGTNTAGDKTVDILATNATEAEVVFTGTNEVGQQVDVTFNSVSFAPDGSISLISDEWGNLEITGEVQADGSGNFGTMTVRDVNSA